MATWQAPPSFEEYVRTRHLELLRFAHALAGDHHLADDLVQDALERTGMHWSRIRRQEDPEGYLRRIIVNRYVSRWRSLRRERLVPDTPDRAYTDADPHDRVLWQLLGTLPRRQRTVLVLRFYEDLSQEQVAAVLGCSVGAVKAYSSRGMARLRAALAATTVEDGVRR